MQCDNDIFMILTSYRHAPKANGISKHIITEGFVSLHNANIGKITRKYITRLKHWKMGIGNQKNFNIAELVF